MYFYQTRPELVKLVNACISSWPHKRSICISLWCVCLHLKKLNLPIIIIIGQNFKRRSSFCRHGNFEQSRKKCCFSMRVWSLVKFQWMDQCYLMFPLVSVCLFVHKSLKRGPLPMLHSPPLGPPDRQTDRCQTDRSLKSPAKNLAYRHKNLAERPQY